MDDTTVGIGLGGPRGPSPAATEAQSMPAGAVSPLLELLPPARTAGVLPQAAVGMGTSPGGRPTPLRAAALRTRLADLGRARQAASESPRLTAMAGLRRRASSREAARRVSPMALPGLWGRRWGVRRNEGKGSWRAQAADGQESPVTQPLQPVLPGTCPSDPSALSSPLALQACSILPGPGQVFLWRRGAEARPGSPPDTDRVLARRPSDEATVASTPDLTSLSGPRHGVAHLAAGRRMRSTTRARRIRPRAAGTRMPAGPPVQLATAAVVTAPLPQQLFVEPFAEGRQLAVEPHAVAPVSLVLPSYRRASTVTSGLLLPPRGKANHHQVADVQRLWDTARRAVGTGAAPAVPVWPLAPWTHLAPSILELRDDLLDRQRQVEEQAGQDSAHGPLQAHPAEKKSRLPKLTGKVKHLLGRLFTVGNRRRSTDERLVLSK